MFISTVCESGTRAAPNIPCRRRDSTISTRDCDTPQSIEATVKPVTETRRTRLSPKRPVRNPVVGVMIAAATR